MKIQGGEQRKFNRQSKFVDAQMGVRGYVITYAVGDDSYEEGTLNLGGDALFNYWLWQERDNPCDYSLLEQVKSELLDNIKII